MNSITLIGSSVLDSLLTTSWQASIVVGLIVLVSWVLRHRLSARAQHALWFVLLIKLMVPLLPASPISLFNWIPERVVAQPLAVEVAPTPNLPVASPDSPTNGSERGSEQAVAASHPTPQSVTTVRGEQVLNSMASSWGVSDVVTWIWLGGCLFFFGQMGYQNVSFSRSLRNGKRIEDPKVLSLLRRHVEQIGLQSSPALVETSAVTVPAVYGFWRPCLILPLGMTQELSEERLGHVVMHELAHLKRRDLLVLWIATVLRTLHWFNPVIWFAVSQIRRDCEVATDALALQRTGEGEGHAYGETILHLLRRAGAGPRLPGLVGIVGGKSEIARRIVSIRDFRSRPKRTIWAMGVAGVIGAVTLTQALPELEQSLSEPVDEVLQIICSVVDPEGNPVPDAVVELGTKDWFFSPYDKTDANGQFKVVESRFKPDMVVRAKGFAPTLYAFDYDLTKTNRIYQLEAAATLSGRVQDADGNPIADAEVIPGSWYKFSSFERGLKTAADGTFAWREAPNHGKVYLTVFAKNYKAIRDYETPFNGSPVIQMSKPDRVVGTVVDSRTGEPIPKFRFEVGQRQQAEGQVMNTRRRGDGKDGKFDVEIDWPAHRFHMVTVLADGYAPSVSKNFQDGDGTVRLRFELERETVFRPLVLQPDGSPAAGAVVVQAKANDHEIWMNAPRTIDLKQVRSKEAITGTVAGRVTETDGEGRASIKPVVEAVGVVITHESGIVELELATLQSASEIRLRPWGRIEGRLLSEGKPAIGERLTLWRLDLKYTLVVGDTVTDEDGRFVFDGITAGEYRPERGQGTMVGWVQVDAGVTSRIVLGEDAVSIVGQAKLTGPPIEDLNWQRESYYLETHRPLPADIQLPTEAEQRENPASVQDYIARRDAFWKSPEGIALKRTERRYAVEIDQDGRFRIEDVPPGEYVLAIQVLKTVRVSPRSTQSHTVAYVRKIVQVPSRSDEPDRSDIDLGILELTRI